MCKHQPPCPQRWEPDRLAARIEVDRPEQGWALLCNGVVLFEDDSELMTVSMTAHRAQGNRDYVRALMTRNQPEFARALARAERELACHFRRPPRGSGCRLSDGTGVTAKARLSVTRAA
jgi:hypothetical protein